MGVAGSTVRVVQKQQGGDDGCPYGNAHGGLCSKHGATCFYVSPCFPAVDPAPGTSRGLATQHTGRWLHGCYAPGATLLEQRALLKVLVQN